MANRCSKQDAIRTHLHDAVYAFLMVDADLCRQPNERLPDQELVPRFAGLRSCRCFDERAFAWRTQCYTRIRLGRIHDVRCRMIRQSKSVRDGFHDQGRAQHEAVGASILRLFLVWSTRIAVHGRTLSKSFRPGY